MKKALDYVSDYQLKSACKDAICIAPCKVTQMIFAVLEDWYHHIVLTHSCKVVSFLHICVIMLRTDWSVSCSETMASVDGDSQPSVSSDASDVHPAASSSTTDENALHKTDTEAQRMLFRCTHYDSFDRIHFDSCIGVFKLFPIEYAQNAAFLLRIVNEWSDTSKKLILVHHSEGSQFQKVATISNRVGVKVSVRVSLMLHKFGIIII